MIDYKEYEKAVYDWLKSKNKQDENFTFSLRMKGSKNSELDYFIGTENSSYFGTTFWTLPVNYPGSSSDCIDLIFDYKENNYSYNFEFGQTKNPIGKQNESVLNLVKFLKESDWDDVLFSYESNQKTKMFSFATKSREVAYDSLVLMFKDIEQDLKIIIPLVERAIEKEKIANSEFVAHRISKSEFKKMEEKLEKRFQKYAHLSASNQTDDNTNNSIEKEESKMNIPLNKILYGPPGTGKTYKTKKLAVEIIEGVKYSDSKEDRLLILDKYEAFAQSQNIKFTTFHQSMSYEDFVEGIKPETNENNDVIYSVQDGIFKAVCNAAIQLDKVEKIDEKIDFSTKTFFKMSLGGKNRKEIHDWCIDNNYISLGWGGNNNYSTLSEYKHWNDFKENFIQQYSDLDQDSTFNKQAMYCFQHWMKVGDVVVATLGNNVVDAIGIIEGEYEFYENKVIPYHHFRKVKWLSKNLNASPKIFIDKNISQQTIYKFADEDVKLSSFEEKFSAKNTLSHKVNNHVLIIDEINRGNVSAIFGELITLLEADKRKGCQEEVTLTLPYSKENFSVPNNVFIIGTMNTADRSVEALDTALRRRFSFEELLPKPDLLSSLEYKDVDLKSLLEKINQRIELLIDKDHQIGHSYFFEIKNLNDLKNVFKDKVIPLLEEYFYGDFGKIGLVLGEAFIEKNKTASKNILAKFSAYEEVDFLTEKQLFRLKDIQGMDVSAFVSVYESTEG